MKAFLQRPLPNRHDGAGAAAILLGLIDLNRNLMARSSPAVYAR